MKKGIRENHHMHSQGKTLESSDQRKSQGKNCDCGVRGYSTTIQRARERTESWNKIIPPDRPGKELGSWDQGYSTTVHVQRIGERTGTVGSGNIQFKN